MKRYILFLFAISIIQHANALEVTIEGLNYFLYPQNNEATLTYGHTCIGEVDIPSEVSYNGETFVVKSMIWCAFYGNTELTSVKIPKSIESILHDYPYEYDNLHGPFGTVSPLYMNPFMGCTALESIEVDSENPSLKSIDGVLFSQDGVGQYYYKTNNYQGTGLYCYPEGKQKEAYIIPENVEWIGADAFSHNQYLTALTMPNSLKHICQYAFEGCRNLANIYCYADNAPTAGNDIFKDTPIASATLHVPAGSVDKYKATSPWSGFGNIVALAEQYYPEGTKWTEIRLDTLKYDSWYSKVGDSWVPNFETIEYHVEGDYTEKWGDTYKCVFSNDPEWMGTPLLIKETSSDVSVSLIYDEESKGVMWPATVYQFNWSVGKGLYYEDLLEASSTGIVPYYFFYGVIDEIKEGDFGGVRPLKYVDLDGKAPALEFGYCIDTNGGRIIQGIGITEWNDGECIFGPPNPNLAKTLAYGERHYRSMLVHFERDGEVLYNVWPRKGSTVEVTIDDLNYFLYLDRHEAVLTSRNNCSGEVDIPSEVRYNDETFVVKSMTHTAFHNNSELTKVRIPKTIEEIIHYYPVDPDWLDPPTGMANPIYVNPFKGCIALESIEVDEENPCLKSIDGVLFSQDGVGQYYYKTGSYSGTGLYCYPEGARQESYTIPESVEWIGGAAFPNNQYLTTLTIPNSMKHICYDAFSGCSNLTDVYCYAENAPIAWDGAFRNVPIASATLHVPAGSIDKYKTTSPWSSFGNIVALAEEPVTFTRDQMATIILPTEPDASKGKYYRLDRVENGQIVFEQELQPRARVPYIIVPSEDFSIDPGALDLEGLQADTVSIGGISFIGSYVRKALPQRGSGEGADSFYIDIIDTTPDCSLSPSGETGQKAVIGALRAYLSVRWDDPIDYGGTRGPQERLEVVLRDHGTSIGQPREEEMVNGKPSNGECFDLCGRKIVNGNRSNGKYPKEIYIEKGRKRVVK